MQSDLRRTFESDVAAVQEVLREWDPIGVFPNWDDSPARDEYDSYAPEILAALYVGQTVEAIADHLQAIRTRTMGLPARRDRDLETAKLLLRLQLRRS